MSLKECEVALRKATAEVEAIELANKKIRLALEKEKQIQYNYCKYVCSSIMQISISLLLNFMF